MRFFCHTPVCLTNSGQNQWCLLCRPAALISKTKGRITLLTMLYQRRADPRDLKQLACDCKNQRSSKAGPRSKHHAAHSCISPEIYGKKHLLHRTLKSCSLPLAIQGAGVTTTAATVENTKVGSAVSLQARIAESDAVDMHTRWHPSRPFECT